MANANVNLRCSGRMHKISIMPGGAFVLHNHTKAEIDAERILAALGGEPCRCVQILDVWRQQNDWRKIKEKFLPVGLRPSFREASALFENRKRQRRHMNIAHVDKLTTPIAVRIKNRGTDLIKKTWLKVPGVCLIRFAPRDGLNVRATCFLMNGHHCYVQSTPLTINIAKWCSRVHKRGLAIIDNVFVLDILSSDENGHIVQAVRVLTEGKTIVSVTKSKARVTIAPNGVGAPKLTWLTDEQ
ncbi:MAG: hypothetical protein DDT32_01739 [Syntrophomonadaceae bacterium]|nr:hypothetical protein [Bacillota bacterium]